MLSYFFIMNQKKVVSGVLLLLLFAICFNALGQDQDSKEELIDALENYMELPREVVYVHTNKTTYIRGEQIGFAAYVFNKATKKLSEDTSNLYVVLEDQGTIVKQQLLRVEKGVATSSFAVDSLLSKKAYTLKAYTNWMRNFKEPNAFEQQIRVLAPENSNAPSVVLAKLEAQFQPEGGELSPGIENLVSVSIKDSMGLGIPYIEGMVFNSANKNIQAFKVNELGLGKFLLTPDQNENYKVRIRYNGEDLSFALPLTEKQGMVLRITDEKDKISLRLKSGSKATTATGNNDYSMVLHNGSTARIVPLPKFVESELQRDFSKSELFPGVNIFTILDNQNQPLTERLYFNYQGLSVINTQKVEARREKDSISITLVFPEAKVDNTTSLSVSVLPSKSIANTPHHNILSYSLLQPYILGSIENAPYYFSSPDAQKEDALNLFLSTQESSYNWETIFNSPPEYDFDFETGIGFTIQRKDRGTSQLIIYPYANKQLELVAFEEGQNLLERNELFPFTDVPLRISKINKKGEMGSPDVKLSFSPNKIPRLAMGSRVLGYRTPTILKEAQVPTEPLKTGVEQLKEVVVSATKQRTELEILQSQAPFGEVEEMDEKKIKKFLFITNYIRQQGFDVRENLGDLFINNRLPPYGIPSVYLNGNLLNLPGAGTISNDSAPVAPLPSPLNVLIGMQLSEVQYVEINRYGLGEAPNSGGVIRIYSRTKPIAYGNKKETPKFSSYSVPLFFEKARKYYLPKYSAYNTAFYNAYGVVGWFPKLRPSSNGRVQFSVPNTETPELRLHIEGMTTSGDFITQKVNVPLN